MAINEQNVKGKKYRVWDAASNLWKRMSFWTSASDVEFDNGVSLEASKVYLTKAEYDALPATKNTDNVDYYTTDDTSGQTLIAKNVTYNNASSGLKSTNVQDAVDEVNSSLGDIRVYVSDDGKLHFVDKEGADTELPFNKGLSIELLGQTIGSINHNTAPNVHNVTLSKNVLQGKYLIITSAYSNTSSGISVYPYAETVGGDLQYILDMSSGGYGAGTTIGYVEIEESGTITSRGYMPMANGRVICILIKLSD